MEQRQRKRLQTTSWFAVVRAYNECTRRYARLLRHFGLTIPQFDAMSAIHQLAGDATPKAIAERLVVTRGNITGVLQRLKDRGLLATRHNDHDGRSFVCRLTAPGQTLLGQARSAAALFIDEQLSPFDDEALRDTERRMTRMHAHLQTIDPDAVAARVPR